MIQTLISDFICCCMNIQVSCFVSELHILGMNSLLLRCRAGLSAALGSRPRFSEHIPKISLEGPLSNTCAWHASTTALSITQSHIKGVNSSLICSQVRAEANGSHVELKQLVQNEYVLQNITFLYLLESFTSKKLKPVAVPLCHHSRSLGLILPFVDLIHSFKSAFSPALCETTT